MNGYDLDGVVTADHIPDYGDVIVTGRSFEEGPETNLLLRDLDIYCPIYYNPVCFQDKTLYNSGWWKARVIRYLNLSSFYEDDERQVQIIVEELMAHDVRNCNVIKVG